MLICGDLKVFTSVYSLLVELFYSAANIWRKEVCLLVFAVLTILLLKMSHQTNTKNQLKKCFFGKFLQVFLSYWEFLSFLLWAFRTFYLIFFKFLICNGKFIYFFNLNLGRLFGGSFWGGNGGGITHSLKLIRVMLKPWNLALRKYTV